MVWPFDSNSKQNSSNKEEEFDFTTPMNRNSGAGVFGSSGRKLFTLFYCFSFLEKKKRASMFVHFAHQNSF